MINTVCTDRRKEEKIKNNDDNRQKGLVENVSGYYLTRKHTSLFSKVCLFACMKLHTVSAIFYCIKFMQNMHLKGLDEYVFDIEKYKTDFND